MRASPAAPLPRELEDAHRAKAEGNPFFAEEITRTLVEEGLIVRGDGAARSTRPVDEIAIPGTVQELIGARLDRLGPHAKRVVQVAAVLGRQFHRDQLAACSPARASTSPASSTSSSAAASSTARPCSRATSSASARA